METMKVTAPPSGECENYSPPNIDNDTAPPSGHNENYTPIPNDTAPPGGDSENYTPQW